MSKEKANSNDSPEWERVHREACDREQDTYIDPTSGYQVFTKYYLSERGFCCESGCRHCPYGYQK